MPIVAVNGIKYVVASGIKIGELLAKRQLMSMPCGGHGRCGKCRVRAWGALSALTDAEKRLLSREEMEKGVRLACCVRVEGDCAVEGDCIVEENCTAEKNCTVEGDGVVCLAEAVSGQIRVAGDMPDIPLKPAFYRYGAAFDIGTTTLAARLYDTEGKLLAECSRLNPQSSWGADVISRIEASLSGTGENTGTVCRAAREEAGALCGATGEGAGILCGAAGELARAVCGALDGMLVELSAGVGIRGDEIDAMTITGNTVMLHLLTGTSTEPLSHAPFAVKRLFGETVSAEELGLAVLHPDTEIYLAPCISAFAGADLVTALLACGIGKSEDTQLLVDIGTNGEMALWQGGKLYCCSAAAGPAFEGAGISAGMGGVPGAIDRVEVQDGKIIANVIGGGEPRGICGSGIVDAVACLLETGQVDETGYMESTAVIAPSVEITREDIRAVQLAKGAIHAGILTLLSAAGVECGDVSRLFIAGGFGSYLNADNAGRIGLLPAELISRIHVAGNAALSGASMLLINRDCREDCRRYAELAEVLELSLNPVFAEEYIERMMF